MSVASINTRKVLKTIVIPLNYMYASMNYMCLARLMHWATYYCTYDVIRYNAHSHAH